MYLIVSGLGLEEAKAVTSPGEEEKGWEPAEINVINEEGEDEYEEVKVTVDSGAVVTVGPKHQCTGYPIEPTEASRAGRDLLKIMEFERSKR